MRENYVGLGTIDKVLGQINFTMPAQLQKAYRLMLFRDRQRGIYAADRITGACIINKYIATATGCTRSSCSAVGKAQSRTLMILQRSSLMWSSQHLTPELIDDGIVIKPGGAGRVAAEMRNCAAYKSG